MDFRLLMRIYPGERIQRIHAGTSEEWRQAAVRAESG